MRLQWARHVVRNRTIRNENRFLAEKLEHQFKDTA